MESYELLAKALSHPRVTPLTIAAGIVVWGMSITQEVLLKKGTKEELAMFANLSELYRFYRRFKVVEVSEKTMKHMEATHQLADV
jgi:hypothetical protein